MWGFVFAGPVQWFAAVAVDLVSFDIGAVIQQQIDDVGMSVVTWPVPVIVGDEDGRVSVHRIRVNRR
jgi:hypothetical protein